MGTLAERQRWSTQAASELAELGALVERSSTKGWGASATATLADGAQIFVKRLPLTEREHARPGSTRNHFQLALYYQYGVGSAGFGVWRELALHEKTSRWVLDGACPRFPLLVHHRVMPVTAIPTDAQGWVESEDYITYWNASRRLASFIEARRTSPCELWLVFEHIPHRMFEWIVEHQARAAEVVDAQIATLRFLHDHGVFHFDAHFGNVVTDGATPFLTDFGLANDRSSN